MYGQFGQSKGDLAGFDTQLVVLFFSGGFIIVVGGGDSTPPLFYSADSSLTWRREDSNKLAPVLKR